jgi:3-isopropylmalate dehydrogenase
MLGAVGGPKWDGVEFSKKPERALLKLKKRIKIICQLKTCNMF